MESALVGIWQPVKVNPLDIVCSPVRSRSCLWLMDSSCVETQLCFL